MSLTFPAAYSAKLHSSSIDVDWLFHFVNDNAGVVYLASKDRTVGSNRYYGVIEDSGEITRELDLINCVASIGEISISCVDKYKTDTLTAELLHNGTDYYINQQVLIYECANDESTLANCPLLFEGRLKEIDIQGNSCVLIIEQWTPFDHIKIPTTQDGAGRGVYEPIIYGDFAVNADGGLCENVNLYPAPYFITKAKRRYYIGCKSIASNGDAHYYDKRLNKFIPFEDSPSASAALHSMNSVYVEYDGQRDFSFYPDDVDDAAYDNTNEWDFPDSAIDENDGTSASDSFTTDATVPGAADTTSLVLMLPKFDGYWDQDNDELYILIDADLEIVALNNSPADADAWLEVSIDNSTWHEVLTRSTVGTSSTDGTGDVGTGNFDSETIDISAELTGEKLPDKVYVRLRTYCQDPDPVTKSIEASGVVREIYMRGALKWDETTDAGLKSFNDLDTVYIGDDGLPRAYSGGSGTTDMEVHEVHRDLMNRFGGIDYANAQMDRWAAPGPNMVNNRNGWIVRFWLLEPRLLKEVLEQLQFEGCFIFMLVADSDGSGNAGGRYVWVEDTYTNGDFPDTDGDPVVQVLDETDYVNSSIGHTDLFEIITKTTYKYNRHPATGAYKSEESYDNTTERDRWNLGTDHYEQINLDYLIESANGTEDIYDSGAGDNTPNESIVLYRDNIQKEPKILFDCEITSKKKMNIEYGDIVQFNDSNVNPYGESWANLFFMVISERRSKMGLSITAREVYRA